MFPWSNKGPTEADRDRRLGLVETESDESYEARCLLLDEATLAKERAMKQSTKKKGGDTKRKKRTRKIKRDDESIDSSKGSLFDLQASIDEAGSEDDSYQVEFDEWGNLKQHGTNGVAQPGQISVGDSVEAWYEAETEWYAASVVNIVLDEDTGDPFFDVQYDGFEGDEAFEYGKAATEVRSPKIVLLEAGKHGVAGGGVESVEAVPSGPASELTTVKEFGNGSDTSSDGGTPVGDEDEENPAGTFIKVEKELSKKERKRQAKEEKARLAKESKANKAREKEEKKRLAKEQKFKKQQDKIEAARRKKEENELKRRGMSNSKKPPQAPEVEPKDSHGDACLKTGNIEMDDKDDAEGSLDEEEGDEEQEDEEEGCSGDVEGSIGEEGDYEDGNDEEDTETDGSSILSTG